MIISKAGFCIAASICGISFIGYCIYFDRRRRNDPNFKNKLKERRKVKLIEVQEGGASKRGDQFDKESVVPLFIREVMMGENMQIRGNLTECIDHYCLAVLLCSADRRREFLNHLKCAIPVIYPTLLQRLAVISRAIT